MTHHDRYWQAKKITLIGALINALLGAIKVMGGVFFHSHALIADGAHSFSDLLTDGMVLFASKYGSQDADESHPYGHQRIETAATLFLALLLILVGVGIAWHSLSDVFHKNNEIPTHLAIAVAILSIFANEGLFHYTRYIGNLITSDLIIANAWHHRSDAGASVIVLVGLLGSMAGFTALDATAAIVVGLLIIKMGISYGWNSVKELVDSGVDVQTLEAIQKIITSVNGVKKIHQLRSRMMGRDIFIDVHVLVAPYLSVSEGHYIAQHVHCALMTTLHHVKDVTVHVDPEDDEIASPSLHLPNRIILEQRLLHPWQKDFPFIQTWIIHYLDGQLIIDVFCENTLDQCLALPERIHSDLQTHFPEAKVRLYTGHQGQRS
ncbi:MAG: cation diffusion facilitator family transporter [Legionellales bacterium]|nr:cation diffusion facilitator family transporter [Legionellales bacterium]